MVVCLIRGIYIPISLKQSKKECIHSFGNVHHHLPPPAEITISKVGSQQGSLKIPDVWQAQQLGL